MFSGCLNCFPNQIKFGKQRLFKQNSKLFTRLWPLKKSSLKQDFGFQAALCAIYPF